MSTEIEFFNPDLKVSQVFGDYRIIMLKRPSPEEALFGVKSDRYKIFIDEGVKNGESWVNYTIHPINNSIFDYFISGETFYLALLRGIARDYNDDRDASDFRYLKHSDLLKEIGEVTEEARQIKNENFIRFSFS